MTVEASLVVPMVLCIIVICLYVTFFLYDRCLFYQDAYILCFRESYRKEEGEPSVDADQICAGVSEQMGTKYFFLDSVSASASAEGKWGIYQGTAVVAPAVFGDYYLMPKDIWELSFTATSRKTDPAWSIRNWRRKNYVVEAGLEYLISS